MAFGLINETKCTVPKVRPTVASAHPSRAREIGGSNPMRDRCCTKFEQVCSITQYTNRCNHCCCMRHSFRERNFQNNDSMASSLRQRHMRIKRGA